MIEKPGIYRMSNDEYQADPAPEPSLSRGMIADLLFKCPYLVWYNNPRLNPDYKPEPPDDKFDLGTAAHDLLLQGIDNVAVIEADDWRGKDARAQREGARAEGKIPLLRKQYDTVNEMVESAIRQIRDCDELQISDLKRDGKTEQSLFWTEGEWWHRVRPDWLSNDGQLCADYKTTGQSASPDAFIRSIVSNGLDIQSSFYKRGIKAVTETAPHFVFIVQETAPPYLCSFLSLSPEFEHMADQKVSWGMDLWRYCFAQDNWPAYPKRIAHIEPPAWALSQWENRAQEITL